MSRSLHTACPILFPNDYLHLAAGVTVHGNQLQDTLVGMQHQLHGAGKLIAEQIEAGCLFGKLEKTAKQHAVEQAHLRGLLGFLNTVGALRIDRTRYSQLHAEIQWLQSAFLGTRLARLRRRYPASIRGITVAVLRGCLPVIGAIGVGALLSTRANVGSGISSLIAGTAAIAIFVFSVIAHEMSHLQLIKRYGTGVVVVQAGAHVTLLRQKVSSVQEVRIAIIGPAGGIALCLAAVFISVVRARQNIAWAAGGIAVLHLLSLLPNYSDGKNIWTAIFYSTTAKEIHE